MSQVSEDIFISLGSNQGCRFEHLRKAVMLLKKELSQNLQTSLIYETDALLPPNAPDAWDRPYLNMVVKVQGGFNPDQLLNKLQKIEDKLGRERNSLRWAPRSIDLDILAWGNRKIDNPHLTIPHPELKNRPFLIALMASLDPLGNSPSAPYCLGEWHHLKGKKKYKCYCLTPSMVGILNITPDSFSDGGNYIKPIDAIQKMRDLISEGAAVIDIGAQSTRPGAQMITTEEEWRRLEPVLEEASGGHALISLDTVNAEIAAKALKKYSIDWINDVSGGKDVGLLKVVADYGCRVVITHSPEIPPSKKGALAFNRKPIELVMEWAEKKLDECMRLGISKDQIILDPGIGMGKSALQSFSLLNDVCLLKKWGCEILVGHSRKPFLRGLEDIPANQRDLETLGVSHGLWNQGVDFLRVHDVEAHHRSFSSRWMVEK